MSSFIPSKSFLMSFAALALTSIVSLIFSPYSKVEESFNLQATHDLYYHGIWPALKSSIHNCLSFIQGTTCTTISDDLSHYNHYLESIYDHLQYPGVVPRTFIGPFIITMILRVITFIIYPLVDISTHPYLIMVLSRAILLSFNVHAHARLAKAANNRFNNVKSSSSLLATYFMLITASQFHIPFYGSRMLPNIFALVMVTHAYAEWFNHQPRKAAFYLVSCTAVFRCDVIILLFTIGLIWLIRSELKLLEAIQIGIFAGIISLACTVPIDSILWQRPIWPEGEVLLFNTVDNRSSEYGTSPWYWYFANALPKGMLFTIFLLPVAFIRIPHHLLTGDKNYGSSSGSICRLVDFGFIPFLAPIIVFIALYSILPHKEVRFIFVAFPMLNLASAIGLLKIHRAVEFILDSHKSENQRSSLSSMYKPNMRQLIIFFMFLFGIGAIIVTLIGSSVFMIVSNKNYPGGDALAILNSHLSQVDSNISYVSTKKTVASVDNDEAIDIYIDVASSMTGVSLFGQRKLMHTPTCNGSENTEMITNHGTARCKIIKGGYEAQHATMSSSIDVFFQNSGFDYILTEVSHVEGYEKIGSATGNPRLDFRRGAIQTQDVIFVLKRIG